MKIDYYIVVEKQEYIKYAKVIDSKKILILPQKYLDEYDTFWERADDNKTGPGPARNYCWEHSIKLGYKRHWVLDDNLYKFMRLYKNKRYYCRSIGIFKACEDFVDRYENVALAGMNYSNFCHERSIMPPYILNTRIYSILLIKNDISYRWRGRYNEDTDLSLNVLKDGYCTILFNAFLVDKTGTQRLSGGNTDEFYKKEGTKPKSQMLVDMHPDVSRLSFRWNRWHHYVNYKPFKKNKLIKRKNIVIKKGINEYGMVLNKKK